MVAACGDLFIIIHTYMKSRPHRSHHPGTSNMKNSKQITEL